MQRFEDQFQFIRGEVFLSFQSTTPATMTQDYKPKTHAAALAMALVLAVTATTEKRAAEAAQLASNIAEQMNDEVRFEAVKESVEACVAYFSEMPA